MRPSSAVALLCLPVLLPLSIPAAQDSDDQPPIVVYDAFTSSSLSIGYENNILDSAVTTANDWFSRISADSSLLRMADSGSFLMLYLLAEDTRYLNTPEINYEQFISGAAEYAVPAGSDTEVGIQANYTYLHSILDASRTEVNMYRILVESHDISMSSYWRRTLSDHWAAQLEIEGRRQIYTETLDHFSEASAKAEIIYSYGNRSDVSIDWQSTVRQHDTRSQYNRDGTPRNGTDLLYYQNEISSRWRHHWDEQRNLQTTTRISARLNRDNGSGYYDYNRLMFRQQIQWEKNDWRLKITGGGSAYRYRIQQIDGSRISRSLLFIDTRVEKRLTPHWKIHVATRHEWNISNDPLDEYRGWTASVGTLFEF